MSAPPTPEGRKWSNRFFGVLFLLSLLLFLRIIWPFVLPVLLGAFVAVLFMPLQDFLAVRLHKKGRLPAVLSTVGVFLLILVPLGILLFLVAKEILGAATSLSQSLADPSFRERMLEKIPSFLRERMPAVHLPGDPTSAVVRALSGSAQLVGNILTQGTTFAIDLFLMVVALYYFFLDGRRMVDQLGQLLPMDIRYSQALFAEFKAVTYAIMWGNTLTALVQGALGTVGMTIAGVTSPLLWGAAMVVTALIPTGGTALVWVPVSAVLLFTGHLKAGIFLLLWGVLVISTVDNFLRPRLAGSRMQMHPLLVFLSMFGGLAVIGVMGLIVGPLVAALLMAMVRIYQRDFLPEVFPEKKEEPQPV